MTSLTDKYPTFLNKESWCGLGEHPVSVVVTIVSNGRVPQNSSCQVDTVLLWKGKKHHSCHHHHHSPAAVVQVSKTDKDLFQSHFTDVHMVLHQQTLWKATVCGSAGSCSFLVSLVFIHHHDHWSLSITMASGLYPSPWPLVFIHHHGLLSLSITMISSWSATMVSGLYPSPWSLVFLHHRGRWSLSITTTSSLYPSPWPLVFIHHHDLCSLSITKTCVLYPSPLSFIHHHGLWPLSITLTCGLYPSPWPLVFIHHYDLLSLLLPWPLTSVITTSYFYPSQVVCFISSLCHPLIQHLAPSFFPPSTSIIRNLPNIARLWLKTQFSKTFQHRKRAPFSLNV